MNLLIIPSSLFALSPSRLLQVQQAAPRHRLLYLEQEKLTEPILAETEIIYGCPPPESLRLARSLQWHHLTNAGIEPYGDIRLYANPRVTLTNASGTYGITLAEHALALALALLRTLPCYLRQQQRAEWKRNPESRELLGSTVLILGMGDLGRESGRRFKALGCRVLGVARTALSIPPEADEMYTLDDLENLAPRADIVVNCLPHTRLTEGIFGRRAFQAMRPGSLFLNIGRGGTVDQEALIDALREGRLMGAGLDVTDPEPLPPDSPLWNMENVLITPHSGAVSPLSHQRNFEIFFDLLNRYLAGRTLYNTVDFLRQY